MIFFHGHLWGFLQEFDFNILAWNTDIVSKAGMDASKGPQTTDDLDKMAEQLTVKDSSGNLKQIGFCPWITGNTETWTSIFGGKYYDSAADKWTIDTDATEAVFNWYLKYVKMLGGPDKVTTFQKLFTGDQTPFYSNQLAVEAMGEYTPIVLPDQAPNLKYKTGWLPTGPGVKFGTDQTGGGNVFVLPKGAPHPDLGADFMSYMGGTDAVLQWNVEENNIPPVKAVAFDENFVSKVPLMKDWIDVLKQDMMNPPETSPIQPFFADNLNTARDSIIYGKMTPKEALQDLAKKVDDQLGQFKASHPNG
jgi:multiple sugar transport system substrate-binding protein